MVMLEGVSPETAPLVWDANARAFRPARANAEPAVRYFIKGPLPLPWLHRAAALPGKALHIAVGLWYMRGSAARHRSRSNARPRLSLAFHAMPRMTR